MITLNSTGNRAQVYYQSITLYLIISILKLSECPICLLLRVYWYLFLALHACEGHAHETHAHEVHAHEVHAHEMHAHEVYAYEIHS
jgi:hypothetical protein